MRAIPRPEALRADLVRVARRFPLVCVALAFVAVAAQTVVRSWSGGLDGWLAAGTFAVPALVGTALWNERRGRPRVGWPDAIVVVAFVVFAVGWPEWTSEVAWRRLLHANLAGLLLAAVLPFAGRGDGFWATNRTLFVRFVVATIFAGVLFLGLSLAVASIETLFGASIDDEVFPRLLIALFTVFHPLFVLAGIPQDWERMARDHDLPRPLRVFAQSILLPLVVLYMAILLAYLGRVLITQEWPSGWIGWLVSAVAVAGAMFVLILEPVAREDGGHWVRRARTAWFAGMIPALLMLLAALAQRIDQYGVTENRYFLGLLACWLLVLCLTHVTRRWRDLRWIPASLAFVTVITIAGPWGAYAVARDSQTSRFENLLASVDRWRDGRAVSSSTSVPDETARQLRAKLVYLVRTHGDEALERWADPGVVESAPSVWAAVDSLLVDLEVPLVTPLHVGRGRWIHFEQRPGGRTIDLAGWDLAVPLLLRVGDGPIVVDVDGTDVEFRFDRTSLIAVDVADRADTLLAVDLRPVLLESESSPGSGPLGIEVSPRAYLLVGGLGGSDDELSWVQGTLLLARP